MGQFIPVYTKAMADSNQSSFVARRIRRERNKAVGICLLVATYTVFQTFSLLDLARGRDTLGARLYRPLGKLPEQRNRFDYGDAWKNFLERQRTNWEQYGKQGNPDYQ